MDVVHRAVGLRVLSWSGRAPPTRWATLAAAEKKGVARVAYEVPIFEFQVGDEEGQIPLGKTECKELRACPGTSKAGVVSDIMTAEGFVAVLQAPRGPIPRREHPGCPGRGASQLFWPFRSDADDHGVRGTVVQAAQVSVAEQRRDDGEQDRRADQGPPEAHRAAGQADHVVFRPAACPRCSDQRGEKLGTPIVKTTIVQNSEWVSQAPPTPRLSSQSMSRAKTRRGERLGPPNRGRVPGRPAAGREVGVVTSAWFALVAAGAASCAVPVFAVPVFAVPVRGAGFCGAGSLAVPVFASRFLRAGFC